MSRGMFGQSARSGRWAVLALALVAVGLHDREARADRRPPTAAIGSPGDLERAPLPQRGDADRGGTGGARNSGAWWFGTVGIAAALAIFGAISLASRRFLPQQGSSPLRVVGRTSLSPKHTVYLLQAGDRVLIVGTGPQGAPSLLGALTGPDEAASAGPGVPGSSADERTDARVGGTR